MAAAWAKPDGWVGVRTSPPTRTRSAILPVSVSVVPPMLMCGDGTRAAGDSLCRMREVVIYTDGACSGNPGPGGWGVVLRHGNALKELHGGDLSTTNNRMELMA